MRAEWNFLYDVHGADDDGDNNDDNNGGNKGYNNEGNDTKKNDNNHFICIFGTLVFQAGTAENVSLS